MRSWICLLAVAALAIGCGEEGGRSSHAPVGAAPAEADGGASSDDGGTTIATFSSGAGQGTESSQPADGGSATASAPAPAPAAGGGDDGGAAGETPAPTVPLESFHASFGSYAGQADYDASTDLDGDGNVGIDDFACAKRANEGGECDPSGQGAGPALPDAPALGASPPYQAARPFSNSQDCKFCHPRQFNEWRTSPHAYSGVSPTFYSLVAAGQNSPGAGVFRENLGVSHGGGVGNFCLPCHAPLSFIGLEGRYGNNNAGFADVQPQFPLVCAPGSPINPLQPCTAQNSANDCGRPGLCTQFEGRTCANSPSADPATPFPRRIVHCTQDSDCPGSTGPCIIAPATIYYNQEAQEGINCEVCHNLEPNHQRSCELFRESDSVGVLSFDIEERESGGRRLRLGPYPVSNTPGVLPAFEQGRVNDTLPLVTNAFHESARVDTPLIVPHNQTDRFDPQNPTQLSVNVRRPTALTCEELPYCVNAGPGGICMGGPRVGTQPLTGIFQQTGCRGDFDCGGCGVAPGDTAPTCGPDPSLANPDIAMFPRAGMACETSVDCGIPADPSMNVLQRGIDDVNDETVAPLTRSTDTSIPIANRLDRPDGNYFRSSMMCAGCHDVRPPFVNAVLKSCQEQPSHVCSIDDDCRDLNIGCSDNGPMGAGVEDCGPCVAENRFADEVASAPQNQATATPVDMGNSGYRRVENLFSEWQISLYNHPDLAFCSGNSFRSCTQDSDCSNFGDGLCTVNNPPIYGKVITCQDCHMSNFPLTPLLTGGVAGAANAVNKNTLYPEAKAAIEGSQSNPQVPLPIRRVSTHFMAGVDLPLINYSGQAIQQARRQMVIDSGFAISTQQTPAMTTAGDLFEVHVTVENVGVGHRFPAGFSHERQNWLQVFVQTQSSLLARGIDPSKPFTFDPNNPAASAPCFLQRATATGAEDTGDPVGAAALEAAGCIFRSGFQLDKAHPETGEMAPDGSLTDEDPEDFFVVAGTRMRGLEGEARIEGRPGAEGSALTVQYVCEEATATRYRNAIAAGSGLDVGTTQGFPFQAMLCDPALTPASGPGHTAPGFGNPNCSEGGIDEGPCVPEIELSDGNERGRCALDISRGSCQSDADCGMAGPCLYRCSAFPELECCDEQDHCEGGNDAGMACTIGMPGVCPGGTCVSAQECRDFYTRLSTVSPVNECELESQACDVGARQFQPCLNNGDCPGGACTEQPICVRGARSGLACNPAAMNPFDANEGCPGSGICGDVGPCRTENTGIVNFQNQFRTTANGVCVDPMNPRTGAPERRPIPLLNPLTNRPSECFLNLQCTLQGFNLPQSTLAGSRSAACLINGQCSDDSPLPGEPCTNLTSEADCGPNGTCNVEFNLEVNGRPSESVFIQNHPFNFNSMPPFQEVEFLYDFRIPASAAGETLIVSARLFNRHFPMRFLRNLIGTQTVRPPFIVEAQGDASDPNQCNDTRTIDIDCFVAPIVTLGRASPGGFIDTSTTRWRTNVTVSP